MKNFNKLAIFTFAMFGFTVAANAQSSDVATASATIVTPIAITNTVDMNFGNVAVTNTAGTVVLAPAGGRTTTEGATLPTTSGTVAAAEFNVTGEAGYTYSIQLPTTYTVKHATLADVMIIDTFTSSTSSGNSTLQGGADVITVGATLNVKAAQPSGLYSSEDTGFEVTVNYN